MNKIKIYKADDTFRFDGMTCHVISVVETYKRNVLSVKVVEKSKKKDALDIKEMVLLQYPDGRLEKMTVKL